jgi:hypothetical protein
MGPHPASIIELDDGKILTGKTYQFDGKNHGFLLRFSFKPIHRLGHWLDSFCGRGGQVTRLGQMSGKMVGKWWEDGGKMGKNGKMSGKIMGKCWENGKMLKNDGKMLKKYGHIIKVMRCIC